VQQTSFDAWPEGKNPQRALSFFFSKSRVQIMAGNVFNPYPRSDLTGSYHAWTSNDGTASSASGVEQGREASQLPASGSNTESPGNQAPMQQQRYRNTLNWVQQLQLTQMKPALEKAALRAELDYFRNPQNTRTATPEELAAIAVNNIASRHQLPMELQVMAQNYLADKFRTRGVHHHLSEGSGRLPRHQPPEKFRMDAPLFRTHDKRFFQIPKQFGEPEQRHLNQKGIKVGSDNLLKEDVPALQIARERGDVSLIPSANRYAVVKHFDIDSEEAFYQAESNAYITAHLPPTPRFSEIRSRAVFNKAQYHFSDLAIHGDVSDFLDRLNGSNLSSQQKETARRTLALECIKVLEEMHNADVYPLDFKPENLLMLENGLVGPCDLKGAKLGNILCVDPEATVGYQDPNIFCEGGSVFAKDATKYALGASLYTLMHPESDPPGTEDPEWEGYDDDPLPAPESVDEVARILMQKDPAKRAELSELMNSPCFTAHPVFSQEEFAELCRQIRSAAME